MFLIFLSWLTQRDMLLRGNDFWKVTYAHACELNLQDSERLDSCVEPPLREDLRRDEGGQGTEQEA